MKVLVLGSGFDSLLAAHAASVLSHDVLICARNAEFEPLTGPQILRAPIPMVHAGQAPVLLRQIGDPDTFLDKLYNQGGAGKEFDGINPELVTGTMLWDAVGTYEWLFETYGRFINTFDGGIKFKDVKAIKDDVGAEYVISGIERAVLCGDRQHSFAAARVVTMPVASSSGASITYSGDTDDPWVIESHLFGHGWRSYGAHRHPPVSPERLNDYIIPQGFNCQCHAPMSETSMDLVGQLGAWDPKWKRHESFYNTFANLDGR